MIDKSIDRRLAVLEMHTWVAKAVPIRYVPHDGDGPQLYEVRIGTETHVLEWAELPSGMQKKLREIGWPCRDRDFE